MTCRIPLYLPHHRDHGACRGESRLWPAVMIAVAVAAPAHAQSPDTTESGEPLVVTAEGRPSAAFRAPQSIGRLESDELARIGADQISEALNRIAGVNIQRGNGVEHLTAIRSPVLTAGAGAGSFLFLEDQVPLRSAGFANVNGLADAHDEIARRIEVIKGPSGAVYGANAIHGIIHVLSPEPDSAKTALFRFSGDTGDRFKFSFQATGGTPTNAFFVGASLQDERGFQVPSGLDQQKVTLRHRWSGNNSDLTTTIAAVNINQETAGFVEGEDAFADPVLRRRNDFPQAFRDLRALRWQSRLDWQASEAWRLVLTPFARVTEQEFLQHFLPSQARETNDHWSAGLQAAVYGTHFAGRLSTISGLDVERTRGVLTEFQEIPTIGTFTQGLHYDFSIVALSASPWFQASLKAGPRLRLVAAARLDYTRYDYDNRTASNDVGRFRRPPDRVDDFLTLSPKFTAQWDLAPRLLLHANFARGARPPQTSDLYRLQTLQPVDDVIAPEIIDSLDGGIRSAFHAWSFDLVGFRANKRNFFFRDANGFNVTDGRTRHLGVEASLHWEPLDSLEFTAAATFARHTYRFDNVVRAASEIIRFGDDIDTAPRILANLRAVWKPLKRVEAEAEWIRVGRYFTDAANSNVYDGHDLANLRLRFDVTRSLSVNLAIRNLLKRLYAERADFAFGTERFFPGETRVFSVGFAAAFGR